MYTFQITPNYSVMPDLQFLLDPTSNSDKDSVWVGGLKIILTM
jgi:carbohydrate-selective porin OprB